MLSNNWCKLSIYAWKVINQQPIITERFQFFYCLSTRRVISSLHDRWPVCMHPSHTRQKFGVNNLYKYKSSKFSGYKLKFNADNHFKATTIYPNQRTLMRQTLNARALCNTFDALLLTSGIEVVFDLQNVS